MNRSINQSINNQTHKSLSYQIKVLKRVKSGMTGLAIRSLTLGAFQFNCTSHIAAVHQFISCTLILPMGFFFFFFLPCDSIEILAVYECEGWNISTRWKVVFSTSRADIGEWNGQLYWVYIFQSSHKFIMVTICFILPYINSIMGKSMKRWTWHQNFKLCFSLKFCSNMTKKHGRSMLKYRNCYVPPVF